jgi:hypothetical protein
MTVGEKSRTPSKISVVVVMKMASSETTGKLKKPKYCNWKQVKTNEK